MLKHKALLPSQVISGPLSRGAISLSQRQLRLLDKVPFYAILLALLSATALPRNMNT